MDVAAEASHSKYEVDIEGKLYAWDRDTITPEEICDLAGYPINTEIIEVFEDNTQRVLKPHETVDLKPGVGFAKKHLFKRG
jgi:hypothetical protein